MRRAQVIAEARMIGPGQRVTLASGYSSRGEGTTLASDFPTAVWITVRWDDGTSALERKALLRPT
jgi:hypothetical protein